MNTIKQITTLFSNKPFSGWSLRHVTTLLLTLTLFATNAWGEQYTGTIPKITDFQAYTISDVSWTVAGTSTAALGQNVDGTKGAQIGTAKKPATSLSFTTSGISGTITSVKVNTSGASSVSATVSVTVGGTAFGGEAQNISSSAADYTFTGSATGDIVISWAQTSSKALYIKTITVEYTPAGGGSCSVDPTVGDIMNAVSGITGTGATFTTSAGVSAGTDCSLSAVGFVYSTSANPTLSDEVATIAGYTSGALNKSVSGLTPSTKYYVRAYATNSHGTTYSNEVSFTTTALTGTDYELVMDVNELTDGDQIIFVNRDGNNAMGAPSTNNFSAVAADASTWSISGTTVTVYDDVQVLTLGMSNGNWTFSTDDGYLYAESSSSNHLKVQSSNDANGEWTISLNASYEATITAQGSNTRNILRYNSSSGLFSCYASGQQAVKIYRVPSSCTTPPALSINQSTATVGTPLTLTATGGNGGAITWSVTDGTGSATVTGNTLTPTSAGTVTVKAQQAKNIDGMTTYCSTSATKTITISAAVVSVNLSRNGVVETVSDITTGTLLDDIDGDGAQGGCTKWSFIGWSKTERTAQNIATAMDLVTEVDEGTTYYAVYEHTDGSSDSKSFNFESLATANSWENGVAQTSVTISPVTLTASGGGNNGKYYVSDKTWRMYNGGSVIITVAGGSVTSVSSTPDETFTISAGEASFSPSATIAFKSITVDYSIGTTYYSTTATCDPVWVVSFDGNGSTGGTAPADLEIIRTQSGTLPNAGSLVKEHYDFASWNTKADGSGTHYNVGADFTPTADITLYAEWTEKAKYTITWINGETTHTTTYVYAGDRVVLPDDAPTSCDNTKYARFIGWYTAPSGSVTTPSAKPNGTRITTLSMPGRNCTYYAVFADGGTVASKTYALDITPDDFTSGGYAENDGAHTSTATATDASGATYEVTWTSSNIYKKGEKAQWKAATSTNYTSSIYNNTALGNITDITVTATDASARFDKFSGTSEDPGSDIDFTSGYSYFVIYNWDETTRYTTNVHVEFTISGGTSAPTGYISTCALPTTWSVNYDANGKELSPGVSLPETTIGISQDDNFTVPTDNYIASPGFAQIGWNTDKDATVGITTVPAHNAGDVVTLYAIWQKSQIEVVEVTNTNDIILDHNFGGSTSATIEQLVTGNTNQIANDIFFSKYFEAAFNVKLLAVFNGTDHDIDVSDIRINIPFYSSKTSNYENRLIEIGSLIDDKFGEPVIKKNQEVIFYSWQPTAKSGTCYRDNDILERAEVYADRTDWIPIPFTYATNEGRNAICFGGKEAILLERKVSGTWTPIDVIGAVVPNGSTWKTDESELKSSSVIKWGDEGANRGWYCADGKNIQDTTTGGYGLSTLRCLLIRKFSVKDGTNAVNKNIRTSGTGGFTTLCEEWYGRHVDYKSSEANCFEADNQSSAEGFGYVGQYNYNSEFQKFEEVEDTKFSATYNEETGFTTLHINPCGPGVPPENCVEGGLAGLACDFLKIQVTNADKSQVLDKLEYKVPIIIDGTKETNDAIFTAEGDGCAECDVVVLGNATLKKHTDDADGDKKTIRNLILYPNSTLTLPASTNYIVNSVQFRVQGEQMPVAKLQGNLNVPDQKILVSRRLNNDASYFFSLPYDCDLNDITWSDGEPATLGDGFRIKEYASQARADEGSTAGAPGHWVMTSDNPLKAGKGYVISVNSKKMHELIFPLNIGQNNVASAENGKAGSNKNKVNIHKYVSTTGKTENNWNWNFIAQPYLCAMTPMTGASITAGWLKYTPGTTADPGTWSYEDGGNEYITVYDPSSRTYTQKIFSSITQLNPFVAFFVQAKAEGTFEFIEGNRRLTAAPARHLAAKATNEDESIFVGVTLSGNGQTDETSLRIRPDFTDNYEPGYDLQKFTTYYTARPQVYMKPGAQQLAFQALSDSAAATAQPMGVYCYQAGTYTFALSEDYPTDEVEAVYLTDKTLSKTTNLLYDTYQITTTKQLYTNTRFELNVIVRRRSPQITTDISPTNVSDDILRKVLINGHVYIQRGGKTYDITGKQLLNY